jgi:hypothetical protein
MLWRYGFELNSAPPPVVDLHTNELDARADRCINGGFNDPLGRVSVDPVFRYANAMNRRLGQPALARRASLLVRLLRVWALAGCLVAGSGPPSARLNVAEESAPNESAKSKQAGDEAGREVPSLPHARSRRLCEFRHGASLTARTHRLNPTAHRSALGEAAPAALCAHDLRNGIGAPLRC